MDRAIVRSLARKAIVPAIIAALGLLAYRGLVGYDPYTGIAPRLRSATGWFFSPTGSVPQLIFAAAAVLLYRRRYRLCAALGTPGPVVPAGLLLLSAIALCLWAYYVAAPQLLVPSLALMILGGGWLLGGPPALRAVLVPALFLLFAFPPPAALVNHIVFPMQLATARLCAWLLAGLGIPSLVYGDQILARGEIFWIIETCSGLRAVQTLTMTAVFYAALSSRSGVRGALLIASAPAVGFLANGVRTVSLALNPNSDFAAIHFLQGMLVFGSGLLALAGVDWVLQWRLPAPAAGPRPPEPAAASGGHPVPRLRLMAFGAFLALTGALTLGLPPWAPPANPARIADDFPSVLGEWKSRDMKVDRRRKARRFLGSVGFSEQLHQQLRRNQERVDLFIGVDARLTPAVSPLSPKTALPGPGWEVVERRTIALEPDGRSAESLLIRSKRRDMLVLHWREGFDGLASEVFRSLLSLDRGPLRRPGRALVIRMNTRVERSLSGRAEAEARLHSLVPSVRDATRAP